MAQARTFNPFARRRKAHRFAAQQVGIPAVADSIKAMSAKLEGWQGKVLKYADLVPEVMSGYSFVHNVMDRVELEVQHFDRIENQWKADESPEMQGIERRINGAFSLGRAAALMHLVEETFILVSRDADRQFVFETLAPTEIQRKSGKLQKRVLKDGEKDDWETIADNVTIIRAYTPDPKDRNKAGGPHKALLGLLETMAIELMRDQADAISVLAGAGILLIPTEILPDEGDSLDASDTPGSRSQFETALEDAMVSTVTDRSKGEAIVPVTLYGPAEYLKEVRHMLPSRSESASETGERMAKYIERYARDIDLPAQIILGLGDANHWSDWKVDENTWAYHLEPRAQRIADAIYQGVVKSIIRNLGKDVSEYRLAPNAAQAIAKSDIGKAATNAYRLGAITPGAYVEAIGMDASHMRSDAEEALLILTGAGGDSDTGGGMVQPDRVGAASVNPATIMRQASRVANSQQSRLAKLYRTMLTRIADDAARDGAKAKRDRETTDKVAAGRIDFEGYEPGTYFDKYRDEILQGTLDELGAFLRRIATLTGLDYSHLKELWQGDFTQRAHAVAKEAESIADVVAKGSYKSGKRARIGDNQIRALTSTANGGSNRVDGEAGNTQRPTHSGDDPMVRSALSEAAGPFATRYTWVTGHPQVPFPPHQALEGRSWFSWQEFDALDVGGKDPITAGSVYFPGDHNGCQCDYEIDFVPKSEAR